MDGKKNLSKNIALLSVLSLSLVFLFSSFEISPAYALTQHTLDSDYCVVPMGGTWGTDTCTINVQYEIPSTDELIIPVDTYLEIGPAAILNNTGSIINLGYITNDVNGTFNNNNLINNTNSITNNLDGTLNNDGIITNSGDITNDGIITNSDAIINNNGGTITNTAFITNTNTITNNSGATINNGGFITNSAGITNDGIIINTDAIFNNSGGTIANTNLINNTNTITNNFGGTINNDVGTIDNSGGIDNFGTIDNSGSFSNTGFINEYCGYIFTGSTPTGTINIIPCAHIQLDPIPATTKWGFNYNITGNVTGFGNNVVINWGDGINSTATLTAPTFTATHVYSTSAIGLNTITAYFKNDTTILDTSDSASVTVLKHSTTTSLNLPVIVVEGTSVTASGILNDTDNGKQVPLKTISFTGSVPTGMNATITNGVDFTAGVTPMNLVSCPTCTNPVTLSAGAKVLHAFNGTVITFPPSSSLVSFLLDDMGTDSFTVILNNDVSNPKTFSGAYPDMQLVQISLNGGNMTIISTSNNAGGVGISNIKIDDSAADPPTVFNQTFENSDCNNCASLLLGGGNYFSTGTATPGTSVSEPVTATFAGDSDYIGSSFIGSYAKEADSLAGVGGSTALSATASTGAIYTALVCSVNDPDDDKDSLCNSWEGSGGKGIPYNATFNSVTTSYNYTLGGNTTTPNVYVEYDFMDGHKLLNGVNANLTKAFAAHGIDFKLVDTTDSALTHLDNINAWFDFDSNRNNDFDSIKAQYFGSSSERPTILNAGSFTMSNASNTVYALNAAAGIQIKTPSTETTQGKIILKQRLNFTAPLTTSSVITVTAPAALAPQPGVVEFGTPTATAATTTGLSRVIITTIPFAAPVGTTFTLPAFTTTVNTLSANVTYSGGQILVTTTKLEAKAQAYHYGLGVHAIGANGCNSPTGLAEPIGNDFIVAMGCAPLAENNATHTGTEGSVDEQSGTILHELGHNFNLSHGGPAKILVADANNAVNSVPADKDQNCKPNFISVMSYTRQLPAPLGYVSVANWKLDYSSGIFSAAPLNETKLDESLGLKSSNAVTPVIVWGVNSFTNTTTPITIKTGTTAASSAAAIPINWDNDASTAETTTTTATDINNFGIVGCGATSNGPLLKDYNEWNNLQFDFRTTTGAQALDGSFIPGNKINEPTPLTQAAIAESLKKSGLLLYMTGFYPPVDMNATNTIVVYNTIKGGQSVPLKFEVFDPLNNPISPELTNVSTTIKSFTQTKLQTCDLSAPTDDIETPTTGITSMKYDGPLGQFIGTWKTPTGQANTCWKVTVTVYNSDQSLTAYFKLKK